MLETLDCYCRFYWTSHFERFVARYVHLVDLLCVELNVSDHLIV